MTKENAEKFMALYEQHKAMAKRLAELEAKSEEAVIEGLVKLANDMGLTITASELQGVWQDADLDGLAGGAQGNVGQGQAPLFPPLPLVL